MDEFERPKTRVQWVLGNNCNYHCSYCLEIFQKGTNPFPDDELFLEVCKEIIFHYDELGRDVIFEFVGGEPTLVDKIPDIGNRLHNYPTNIVLKTNGSASLEWWHNTRRYLSEVVISVHREFADIEHIKDVVRLLKDETTFHPINIQVLFPVTNREESWDWGIATAKEFRRKFDLGDIQLLYSNFGKGSSMYLPYKKEQWEEYDRFYGITSTPDLCTLKREQPIYTNQSCYAGVDTLTIDSTGNVFRGWCLQGGIVGNIYQMPVAWPTEPIICKKDICGNGFDQLARKHQL